jgi:hypothetical protein
MLCPKCGTQENKCDCASPGAWQYPNAAERSPADLSQGGPGVATAEGQVTLADKNALLQFLRDFSSPESSAGPVGPTSPAPPSTRAPATPAPAPDAGPDLDLNLDLASLFATNEPQGAEPPEYLTWVAPAPASSPLVSPPNPLGTAPLSQAGSAAGPAPDAPARWVPPIPR